METTSVTTVTDGEKKQGNFDNEEVESSYRYPLGFKLKGITEQTKILRQFIPSIGFVDEKIAEQSLPPNAEGWFAIPRWQSFAKTYNEAVQKVLDLIKQQRVGNFYNHCNGRIGEQYLHQHERTKRMFEMVCQQQSGYDIIIVAAQFGFRHRGRSVRLSREVFTANEFGLGSFETGCMLLTHPNRFQSFDDLWIDCPGDEYALKGDNDFFSAPSFCFYDNDRCDNEVGEIVFVSGWVFSGASQYGSASGFLFL